MFHIVLFLHSWSNRISPTVMLDTAPYPISRGGDLQIPLTSITGTTAIGGTGTTLTVRARRGSSGEVVVTYSLPTAVSGIDRITTGGKVINILLVTVR